jgi:hypothetical protein
MSLQNDLKIDIKTRITQESMFKFKDDVMNISSREYQKLLDSKYVLIVLYFQIGKSTSERVFDFRNKQESYLAIQPKVKNYVIFKTKEGLNNYIVDELSKDELCLICNVQDGHINLDNAIKL